MLENQTIFHAVYSKGTSFNGTTLDGDSFQKYASAHIGYIAGDKREIHAIMTDDVQPLDQWYVFNVVDSQNIFIHAVAVLGVVAYDRAELLVQRYFGETAKPNTRAYFVGEFDHYTLKRYLDNVDDDGRIRLDDIQRVQDMATTQQVEWQDGHLVSHSGSLQRLMFDLSNNDDGHNLLDSMNRQDFAKFVSGLADGSMLDALIVENGKLPQMINRLFMNLQRLGNDELKIENVTQSEPFKKDGAVNIAVMLEFSDRQTLAIVFHNNDTTPAQIGVKDILTSWKFVLNKRDVTAVLQPESGGKGSSADVLAKRIMQVVSKNSAKFKKNNAKKEQDAQRLAELQKEVEDKQALIAELAQKQKDLIERKDSLIHRHLDGGK